LPLPDVLEDRGLLRLQLLERSVLLGNLRLKLIAVVMIVGERRMHLGQRDRGVLLDDLRRAHAHSLMPDRDMLDLDAVAEDVRLPAAITGTDADVLPDHGDGSLRLVRDNRARGRDR